MIPVLLLGGLAIAGLALAAYWKDIVNWLNRIWQKLPSSIKDRLQGAVALVRKIGDTFKNVMKYYSYDKTTKKWSETVVTKEVNESDIPEHIRARVSRDNEADISDDLEEKLKLAL